MPKIKIKTVTPKNFTGWSMSIAQLWGSGPKFQIKCGECGLGFSTRIQMIDNPPVICPYCKTVNVLPLVIGYGETGNDKQRTSRCGL